MLRTFPWLGAAFLLAACSSSSDPSEPGAPTDTDAGRDVSTELGASDATLDAYLDAPIESSIDAAEDQATQTDGQSEDSAADATADAPAIVWSACSGGFSGACGTIQVPLDYSQPDATQISLYIDQVASSNHSRAQLWLLEGGPGGSGADLIGVALQLAQQLPDVDIYTLDHRGVNRSTALQCPTPPVLPDGGTGSPGDQYAQAWQPCLQALQQQWGEGLKQFNTTNASRDLARAIELTRKPDQDVFVYGASYGTYWAQRYVQLFPDQPTAVILDSVVAVDAQVLSDWDLTTHMGIDNWIDACALDTTCKAKLGDDPRTRLESIKALTTTGHCPGVDPTIRSLLAPLFQANMLGPYVFAAMYRYERCTPEDVDAINTLATVAQQALVPAAGFSDALFNNVTYSELWELPTPSYEDLLATANTVLFPSGIEVQATLGQQWPLYPLDQYAHIYPTTSLPVLVMNGSLDIQTPLVLASQVAPHYTAAHQAFVTFPGGNHCTIQQSSMASGQQCGMSIMVSFLTDPTATLDTSCTSQVVPPDFDGIPTNTQALMGVSDMWENGKGPALRTAPDGRLAAELARLRRPGRW